MGRRGEVARAALVEQAERLFAQRGIEAVSLRDVSAAAGQRNHSAAQYHFGDRSGLLAAVFEARMGEVNERRHRALAELDREDRGGEPRALVEAFVVPLVDVIAEANAWYGRFLARVQWDTFASAVVTDLPVGSSYREVVARLNRSLVQLPRSVGRGRSDQLTTLVIGTLAGWEWARDRNHPRLAADLLAAELVTTGLAVITAPDPSRPPVVTSTTAHHHEPEPRWETP
jgi:AcrR family transcriptional regulator